MKTAFFILLLIFVCCSDKYGEDVKKTKWVSTDDTPTGRVMVYELPEKNYSISDTRAIAKIILHRECKSSYKLIRVVLQDKFGNRYGILGLNCETNKYFGGLSEN